MITISAGTRYLRYFKYQMPSLAFVFVFIANPSVRDVGLPIRPTWFRGAKCDFLLSLHQQNLRIQGLTMRSFRESIVVSMCLGLTLVLACGVSPACGEEFLKTTAVYKTVGDLQIRADVYRPDGNEVLPVVVWIHGGALIMGHRDGISGRVRNYAKSRGVALVSIDYRLAPETKIPEIIEDVEDAFRWIRGPAAERFQLDANRIAVTGGSAGGYLALVSGYRVQPRPRALVAFWGYGDLIGAWYSSPSAHARHNRVKPTREEAWKQVSGGAVADSRDRDGNGSLFYVYCRQTGQWPKNVSGWDPHAEPDKFFPYMPVKNVTADWPPTLMIHGTDDTDVPHQQSVMMAAEFSKHGIDHRLISIEKGEHGLGGGDSERIEQAYQDAEEFLDRFLLAK